MIVSGADVADIMLLESATTTVAVWVGVGVHGGYGAAAARTLDILELCGSHSQLCLNAFDVRAGERLQPTRPAAAAAAHRQAVLNKRSER